MDKDEYLLEIKKDIDNLLNEGKLSNYKNQAFAWKLNATFNRTFEESYLWNRALFLATNSCYLIQNQTEIKTAIKGLYECAEIYEYLSELPKISEIYDKEYLSILSALCYDLSGYQANAYCIADSINDYKFETQDKNISLTSDNAIIEQIRLILLKKIPLAYDKLANEKLKQDIGYSLFTKALNDWFQYLLKQEDTDYISSLEIVYLYYLNSGNTYLSHLIFLVKTRILMFNKRCIWNNLKDNEAISNSFLWKKYIRLLAYDYYDNVSTKDIQNRKSIFEFWTSQLRSIENGLMDLDENFVVQMPTSAGKTFIAELLIMKYLVKYPDKKCIYVAPFRALTNEKEVELSKYFSKLGFSVSSLSGSYEIDEFQDVILSETDLLIATPEKIDLLLRLNPDFFLNVSFVVIDEGHIIGDISTRASLLEFLIIRLRIKLPDLRTLFISAVMPPENANEYALWLSGKKSNVLRSLKYDDSNINDEWEPTRKLISYFEWVGSRGDITFQNVITEDETTKVKQGAKLYSFLSDKEFSDTYPQKNVKKETAAALAFKLSEEGNTLVFCAQVPRIKSVAIALLSLISVVNIPDRFKYSENKKSSYYARIWYGEDSYISNSINHGIGIHYGDMPEQVRSAVEEDFRNGSLVVMLSTNTIGQGLNFPIKNLIFYETLIGRINNKNKYIQYRDFWNIVGRAGRAGKETEGKIVYIINTRNDRKRYIDFINKKNIEDAESFMFKVVDAFIESRISQEVFSKYLSILSETYLLDLISEEIIGTDYEDIIAKIINNSLFKIQIDKKDIDNTAIKTEFKKIFKSFENEASFAQLSKYRITGFSFKSNKIIDDFIETNKSELQNLVEKDNYIVINNYFLKLISENEISEFEDYKLDNLGINPIEFNSIIESWINGVSIQKLIEVWKNTTDLDIDGFHVFISKALYYLYPWGISSFLIILAFKLNKDFSELPENVRNLASYMKYGLNNNTSCLARSLGVKSREVSLLLNDKSNRLQGKDFIRWFSNLTNDEIELFDISKFDKDNIKEVALKLTPNSYRTIVSEYEFLVKGTSFNTVYSITSQSVIIGDVLSYRRENHNEHDPFAVLIFKNENPVGYIPREFSKIIASEIDIEEKRFYLIVIDVKERINYNDITVQMTVVDKHLI